MIPENSELCDFSKKEENLIENGEIMVQVRALVYCVTDCTE